VLDHLLIVCFIARGIHERLPRHVPLEDLYSAGVVGLLDALAKFECSNRPSRFSSAATRSTGSAGRYWTACETLTGAQKNCAAKRGQLRKRSRS
jgi:hypothetical protein